MPTPMEANLRGKPQKRGRSLAEQCVKFREELRSRVRTSRGIFDRIYSVKHRHLDLSSHNCESLVRVVKEWMESGLSAKLYPGSKRLGRKERIGLEKGWMSLKKAMPHPCPCLTASNVDDYKKQLQTPLVVTDDYKRHIARVVERLFPLGWDHKYCDNVILNGPSRSACTEVPRSAGGGRKALSREDPQSWWDTCVDGKGVSAAIPVYKYAEVLSSGKLRRLTITPSRMQFLRPLHKTIYDRLSKQRWLLRGKASLNGLPGGIALSGDYKSATDYLSVEAAEFMLDMILERATSVPLEIKIQALTSLRPFISFPDGSIVRLQRGQMMGALLSFPLLCLQNHCATTYALGKVPHLINGDDLVAVVKDEKHAERWFRLLPALGLEPERTKTGIARDYADINSTPFLYKKGRWREVPIIRLKTFLCRSTEFCEVGRSCTTILNDFVGSIRPRIATEYLRVYLPYIRRSNRSLLSLGFRGADVFAAASQLAGLVRKNVHEACIAPLRLPIPTRESALGGSVVSIPKEHDVEPDLRLSLCQNRQFEVVPADDSDLWAQVEGERPFGKEIPRSKVYEKMAKLMKGYKGSSRLYYSQVVKSRSEALKRERVEFLKKTPSVSSRVEVPIEYAQFVATLGLPPPLLRFAPACARA